MSIYVDKLRNYPDEALSLRMLRHKKWCHLIADTIEELDDFAAELGLQKSWRQRDGSPHYDLTEGKRIQALRKGAVEISDEELVSLIRKWRLE